jgi:hypothetical protein
VEAEPEPSREPRGLAHERLRRGERRAGRDDDLHPRAGARVVEPRHALGVGEDPVDGLDDRVRRERALGLAHVHRSAGGHDANAQLMRGLHLGLDQARAAVREHVVMVEDGRAARQRELGEPGPGGGVLGLGIERPWQQEPIHRGIALLGWVA